MGLTKQSIRSINNVPALLGKSNEIGSLKLEIMLTLLPQVRYSMRILKSMKTGFKVQNML
jgi:hypothetical protein